MTKKTKTFQATKPSVEPKPMTPAEAERYEAYLKRREATPSSLKFAPGKKGENDITQDLSRGTENVLAGMAAVAGSVSLSFSIKLADQTINASPMGGRTPVDHANAIAAMMTGLAPQDEAEGLLVAQMVSCHNTAMECLRRACVKDQTFEGRKLNMTFADRFMRTFAVQMEALGKYRKGGQQKVVVEHVHVYPGGQAIVGNVNHTSRGGGESGWK